MAANGRRITSEHVRSGKGGDEMKEPKKTAGKKALNDLTLEKLEALMGEEMDEMSLFDCTVNWFCDKNS